MADHAKFTIVTGIKVYFCDPRSPWQRGQQREHQRAAAPIPATRRRLVEFTQTDLDAIAHKLNTDDVHATDS